MKMSRSILAALALVALCTVTAAAAQPGPGGFRGFGFGGPGGGQFMLLRAEAVQKEIKATEDQIASIRKLGEEMRPAGGAPNFGDMSQEERDKARKEMSARMEKANAKLKEILKPDQLARLEEISIQQRGAMALGDPDVAKKLGLSEEQQQKLREVAKANGEAMREAFQGGDRAKLQELRKQAAEKAMAVLTADQKAAFEKMKGAEFKMPEGAFGGPGGGRGRGGQGGGGGNRP